MSKNDLMLFTFVTIWISLCAPDVLDGIIHLMMKDDYKMEVVK